MEEVFFSAQIHSTLTKPEQMGEEFIQCSWEHFQIKAGSVQLSLKLLWHFTSKLIKLWVEILCKYSLRSRYRLSVFITCIYSCYASTLISERKVRELNYTQLRYIYGQCSNIFNSHECCINCTGDWMYKWINSISCLKFPYYTVFHQFHTKFSDQTTDVLIKKIIIICSPNHVRVFFKFVEE